MKIENLLEQPLVESLAEVASDTVLQINDLRKVARAIVLDSMKEEGLDEDSLCFIMDIVDMYNSILEDLMEDNLNVELVDCVYDEYEDDECCCCCDCGYLN